MRTDFNYQNLRLYETGYIKLQPMFKNAPPESVSANPSQGQLFATPLYSPNAQSQTATVLPGYLLDRYI